MAKPERTALPKNFDLQKAYHAQTVLSRKVVLTEDLPQPLRVVCFLDAAYAGSLAYAAAVSYLLPSWRTLEQSVRVSKAPLPYVPTLLGFREVPAYVAVLHSLRHRPDLVVVDGHGWAHPRRFGLACHVGLAARLPCIGVAKRRLIGELEHLPHETVSMISDGGERVGALVKCSGRRLFVSVGHRVGLSRAITLVETMETSARKRRIPSPFFSAHRLACSAASGNASVGRWPV